MENEEWASGKLFKEAHCYHAFSSPCCLNVDEMAGDGETVRTEDASYRWYTLKAAAPLWQTHSSTNYV